MQSNMRPGTGDSQLSHLLIEVLQTCQRFAAFLDFVQDQKIFAWCYPSVQQQGDVLDNLCRREAVLEHNGQIPVLFEIQVMTGLEFVPGELVQKIGLARLPRSPQKQRLAA